MFAAGQITVFAPYSFLNFLLLLDLPNPFQVSYIFFSGLILELEHALADVLEDVSKVVTMM